MKISRDRKTDRRTMYVRLSVFLQKKGEKTEKSTVLVRLIC